MSRLSVNDNLLYNGNFELAPAFTAATNTDDRWIDGTAGGSLVNELYRWGLSFSGTGTAQFDNTVKYSGSYSMKLSTTAVSSFVEVSPSRLAPSTNLLCRSYLVWVNPSTSYTCTYRMKTEYVSGDATNGARVNFQERNGTGSAVTSNQPSAIKTTTDWTLYTVTFTTNSTTRFINPVPQIYGHQGTATLVMNAWFDEVTIKPTTAVTRTSV